MTVQKVALVTGSGKKRVGWHVADALARRGFDLVVHYRTSGAEAEESRRSFQSRGIQAVAVGADLAKEDEIRQMMQTTLDRFGRIDVLVNCAAIWRRKRLEEVSANDVRDHFETNTLGTFLCAQQAGLAMAAQPEGGCIVNIGDWAVARPYRDYAPYFASKGAIPAITRSLAVELAARNPKVRVNCIHPGAVLFPEDMSEEERQEVIQATLVKRAGHPQDIAQAVLFLVDNDFVTGTCVSVDGGRFF